MFNGLEKCPFSSKASAVVDAFGSEVSGALDGIAARIAFAREKLQQTQKELALAAGLPLQSHKQYERGLRTPGGDALAGYVGAGISANYLVGGVPPILIADIRQQAAPDAFDSGLMLEVIEIVEQLLAEHRRTLAPAKKAELLVTLYEMFRESAAPVQRATVLRLVNLAA